MSRRISISNIAWDVDEDEAVASLLKRYGVDAIDIAPGKYFSDFAVATASQIESVREWWRARGFDIVGMQSLLFGTDGLNMFGGADQQSRMLGYLDHVCRIGGGLGATRLVFGSPRNRDRAGLEDEQVRQNSLHFFQELGDVAEKYGVIVCLEPNPEHYGANFMVDAAETAHVVSMVNHSAIKMQLDTGAITLNGEDIISVLEKFSALIGHVHISEPDLRVIGDAGCDHALIASSMKGFCLEKLITIEMRATHDEDHLVSIERALKKTISIYGV